MKKTQDNFQGKPHNFFLLNYTVNKTIKSKWPKILIWNAESDPYYLLMLILFRIIPMKLLFDSFSHMFNFVEKKAEDFPFFWDLNLNCFVQGASKNCFSSHPVISIHYKRLWGDLKQFFFHQTNSICKIKIYCTLIKV